MQQYRINTCVPESCCVSAVAIADGQLKITLENGQEFTAALPADEKVVVSGELRGEAIQLKNEAGRVVSTINLSSLIPDTKADRFLSEVAYRDADKKLVFTTSAQGEANRTFEVAVEDFMRAATDATLTGNGTTASPLSVVSASPTNKGIVELATPTEAKGGTDSTRAVTPAGLKVALDAALDAAAPTAASAQTAGVVKLGDRVLANDGKTVLGYLVNV